VPVDGTHFQLVDMSLPAELICRTSGIVVTMCEGRARPLTVAERGQIVAAIDATTAIGKRDRAIRLVGYIGRRASS
jgi:hypothetical protein